MSTFAVLYLVDEAIFERNISCGIVSYSLEHAQHIYKRIIGHALDTFLPELAGYLGIQQHSAREITFSNGSFLRVDTTLRGGAYQLVLVSEYGKTCARNPLKAEEVVTGTLQSIPASGRVIIESTGEGNTGFYADMINQAVLESGNKLTALDYKLFFFPWYSESTYVLQDEVSYSVDLTDYFNKLEKDAGVRITQHQRNWYALQAKMLGDKMKQEFPSTVAEAFASSSDAYYFQALIEEAYADSRCLAISPYDPLQPVYVAMDIGVNDLTVLVFIQCVHGEIRVVDFYADSGKGVEFYCHFLQQEKRFLYHTIFLPHDARKRDGIVVDNTYEREFRKLFSHTETKFVVLKQTDKQILISNAKIKLSRCVFYLTKTKTLLEYLGKYRKKWSEMYGRYEDSPYHDISCFIGETLVETEHGLKRIDKIVVGDRVLTPTGYRYVRNVFQYKTKSLLKIKSDSADLICTSHHKIFSNKGIVTADSLRYNDQMITQEECEDWDRSLYRGKARELGFKDFFLSMSQEQRSILMATATPRINSDIGVEDHQYQTAEDHCIELCGSITREKSLPNMISTIWMMINRTMLSTTWNLSPTATTCPCTCLQKKEGFFQEKQYLKLSQPLRSGTHHPKGLSGIESTESMPLLKSRCWKRLVRFARKLTFLLGKTPQCVQTHAALNIEEILEKIPKSVNAISAMKNLSVSNIASKGTVLGVAELYSDIEIEVYDLEVEIDHCYFANGILVSNSHYADAFQYAMQAVTHIETVSSMKGALEKHKAVVEKRRFQI